MLIELLRNFEYVSPGLSPGQPGYYRIYIYCRKEGRSRLFSCEIDVPLSDGEEPLVVREARRIALKNRITQQFADELAEYGVKRADSLYTFLEPPETAINKLPEDCAFLEILSCFDFYARSKRKRELLLIQNGHSAYFEYKVQGDDFIFAVKRQFNIDLNRRAAESLTPEEKLKLDVKHILINALIALIAKELFVSEESVREKYKNLEIKLNRIDYAVLMNMFRQSNPVSQSLQTALQSGNGVLGLEQATSILNHEIYCCLSQTTYTDKMWFIGLMKDVFLGLQNLNQVCILYTQIRNDSHKQKVDVHRNPGTDFWLIKNKSQSWQQLMLDIRQHAFKLLLQLAGIAEVDANNLLKSGTHFGMNSPRDVEVVLNEYRNHIIFSEHRGQIVFADMIFDTHTVKNIDKLINECQYNARELDRMAQANAGL